MKDNGYLEPIRHGSFGFPIAYYAVDATHPRYTMILHWHPEYEIVRVNRGQLHMTLDAEPIDVQAGNAVFIGGGVAHSAIPQDCDYECLVFDLRRFVNHHGIISRQIEDILERRLILCQRVPQEAIGLFETLDGIFAAMRNRQPGYELTVQGGLYQLLGIVVRDGLYHRPLGGSRRRDKQQVSLKNVIRHIEENYFSTITLDDLVRAAGMNRKYFCQFFKEMTHKTPIEYLNHYRVEMAGEQLLASNQTVAEVAISCGFNDMSYFSRMFRRYMGVTPRNYRQRQT